MLCGMRCSSCFPFYCLSFLLQSAPTHDMPCHAFTGAPLTRAAAALLRAIRFSRLSPYDARSFPPHPHDSSVHLNDEIPSYLLPVSCFLAPALARLALEIADNKTDNKSGQGIATWQDELPDELTTCPVEVARTAL